MTYKPQPRTSDAPAAGLTIHLKTMDGTRVAKVQVDPSLPVAQLIEEARGRWNLPSSDGTKYALMDTARSTQLNPNTAIGQQVQEGAELTLVPIYVAA
ncbi:MAG: hypothetical protein ACK41F_00315 [Fimbriimonadaceae bacterium]